MRQRQEPRRSFFKILLLCCLLFAGSSLLRAERLPIKIYTSADGLGSSATFSLVRDARGFIWLCSRDGLVRFDGYRFITYRVGKDEADPAVYNLLPTRNGMYWINLNRGPNYRFVDKGDATVMQPIQQQLANDPRVKLLNLEQVTKGFPQFEDRAGNLWTSSGNGIHLLTEVDGHSVSQLFALPLPGLPANGLTSVTFRDGSDGSFWLGTNWGLVRRLTDGRMFHYTIDPQKNRDNFLPHAPYLRKAASPLKIRSSRQSTPRSSGITAASRTSARTPILSTRATRRLPRARRFTGTPPMETRVRSCLTTTSLPAAKSA